MEHFIGLAGGAAARIVIMPGAGTEDHFPDDWPGFRAFRDAGITDVRVLHTRDREAADDDTFSGILRQATGVWIPGGRQWRLTDTYLGTATHRELHALLDRGGVVGGTSAGASVQAGYMVRGAPEGNTLMMAPGYEAGFGLLRNAAVDQHLLARSREDDMIEVVDRFPALLGIGIDEGTALVVSGARGDVIGRGFVAFYNVADAGDQPYYLLRAGSAFDLAARRTLHGTPTAPRTARDEAEVLAVMHALFDAMRAQDTAAIRAISHPDLRIFVPGEADGQPTLSVSTIDQFIARIAAATVLLDERPTRPEVRMDGNLATIWTGYEFHRGGALSHCGVDAFHLARTSHGWRVIGLAYTARLCAESRAHILRTRHHVSDKSHSRMGFPHVRPVADAAITA
jgi:cyanophycinase